MIERALCVLNPAAGRGAAEPAWERAAPVLREGGVETELVRTSAPGHASEIAATAARAGWPAVVAVGGDGTIQEVANGLLSATEPSESPRGSSPALGIIPAGSGNDFAKPLGVPPDPAAAARALLHSVPRTVDVGRVGERWFMNGVGIGFDARVAALASRPSPLRGNALYAWALLRTLVSHRTWPARVEVDGEEVGNRVVSMITVSNGPCHGGCFWLCPAAAIDDGEIDVLVVGDLGRLGLLGLLGRSTRRAETDHPDVELGLGRRVVVTSERPFPVHADGEIISESMHRVEIELLPRRLAVLAPASPPAREPTRRPG